MCEVYEGGTGGVGKLKYEGRRHKIIYEGGMGRLWCGLGEESGA